MWQNPKLVFNKKPNFESLLKYGFKNGEQGYTFSRGIMNNTFLLNVFVSQNGVTEYEVIDRATDEEYTLAYVESSVGAFVGSVRLECEAVLDDIIKKCYEPNIFKSEYAKLIINYVKEKYGADAEYLWKKFPNNAIFREQTTQKWFGAVLSVEKQKIGIKGNDIIEVIDLKESPENIAELVDGVRYFAGYHMNKKHWYTICLDGSVPIEEIYKRIDISFDTLQKKQKH